MPYQCGALRPPVYRVLGDGSVEVQLGGASNLFTTIDVEDLEPVLGFTWQPVRGGSGVIYAQMKQVINGVRKSVYLHTFIAGFLLTDHIDHNGLNNRRSNLREATKSQNNQNAVKHQGTSVYKGVSWNKQKGKWSARLGRKHLGLFVDEVDAAKSYDKEAISQYGEFAFPNFRKV